MILPIVFPVLYILSYRLDYIKRELKTFIEYVYGLIILTALLTAYSNRFNDSSFLIFLVTYTYLSVAFRSSKTYLFINGPLLIVILFESLFIKLEIEQSRIIIFISFGLSFVVGYTITQIRLIVKERYKERGKFLNHLFNSSTSGLILVSEDDLMIKDINSVALEILNFNNRDQLKELKINNIKVYDDFFFSNYRSENKTYTKELPNNELIKVSSTLLEYKNSGYLLFTLDRLGNYIDIGNSIEYKKLKDITDESYQYLFEKNASMLSILSLDFEIIDLNETLANALEYSKKELIGKKLEFITEVEAENREEINEKIRKGITQIYEKTIISKSGKKIEVEVVSKRSRYMGQDVIISNGRDVADRKKLEGELDLSAQRYKYVTSESSICFLAADLEGNITESNRATERFLGYSKEELLKLHIADIAPKKDTELTLELRSKLISGEIKSGEIIKKYLTKDKRIVYGLFKLLLQKDKDGNPQYFFAQIDDITDLIKAQEKLKISEKSYRDLFNNSEELLYILNRNNEFIDVNEAVIEKYGYKREEIIGQLPDIFSAPDLNDLNMFMNKINEAWSGKKFEALWWSAKKDGTIFPKKLRIDKGIYNAQEVLIATGVDISESYEYEKKLKEKEQSYRDLFERNMAGVYRSTFDGKILECNPAFLNILGYTQDEFEKNRINAKDFHFDKGARQKLVDKVRKERFVKDEKLILKRKDNRSITVLLNVSAIYDEEKKFKYFEGNLIDISQLEEIQNQLKRRESDYIELINSAPFGVVIIRKEKILFVNQKAADILGYSSKEDLIGKDNFEILLKEEKELYEQQLYDLLNNKNIPFNDYVVKKKDRSLVDVECKPSIIFYEGKKSILFSFIDISDKKRIEVATAKIESTEKFNRILKGELKEKEVLLKEVHHRVKNNMQIISSILNLQSNYSSDKDVSNILRDSQSRIRSMALIHEKLYSTHDFSRISFDQYLQDLTYTLISTYKVSNMNPDVEFNLSRVYLSIDQAIPCGLIVNELVANALKYAFSGIPKPTITLELKQEDDRLVNISISDNGVGMPEDVDIKNSKSLGLQLVETLTDQLGGTLEIELTEGTRFSIKFFRFE